MRKPIPFRPSVLPDRDNDILSTFTRSFERARQLVRQDQADTRAQQLHDLEVREREQGIEDRMLDFNLEVARDPALSFRNISARQAEVANIFGRNAAGQPTAEVQAPQIGRFGRASVPRELMPPPGTPGDVQILGESGGRTLTFSQTMADRIRRDRTMAEAEFEETLPARRREREAEDELDLSVRNILGLDPLTTAGGEPIPASAIPSSELGRDLIEQERGGRLALERGVAVAGTPRTSASGGRSADEIRLGQSRGRILTSFRSRLAAAERARPTGVDLMLAERMGTAPPAADRGTLMREAINEAQAVGDITEPEANEMRQQIPQLLQQAGAAAGGGDTPAPSLTPGEVTNIVQMLRRAGSISEAEVRGDLEAENFSPEEIEQILAAM